MTLMEEIYQDLNNNGMVETGEEFGTTWCANSSSWFAVQKFKGRDLSVITAIQLLNNLKIIRASKILKRTRIGAILDDEIDVLSALIKLLDDYLLNSFSIVETAESNELAKLNNKARREQI